jgi:hypothetical protein
MIGAWTLNIGGKIYGPYSSDRMRAFIGEGRITERSLLAREGTGDWHEAREEPEFADLFPNTHTSQPAPALTDTQQVRALHAFGAAGAESGGASRQAQFAIIVDLKSKTPGNLEQAITSLGTAHQLLPNVWIMSTDLTVNAVRNRLVQELGKLDSLFVLDATRGKAAWFNFGPEADVRIRRVWQKAS